MEELRFESRQLGSHVLSMFLTTMLYAKDSVEIKTGNARTFVMWRAISLKDHAKVCLYQVYFKQRNKCPHSLKALSERRKILNTQGKQKHEVNSVGTWEGRLGDNQSKEKRSRAIETQRMGEG